MSADSLADWVRLTSVRGLGGEAQRRLLKDCGSAAAAVKAAAAQADMFTAEADTAVEAALSWAAQPGNAILTLADTAYPQALLDTADPPTLLYAKGRVELLNRPAIAVVGSRNATAQGERDAEAFAAALAAAGLTVVSGLALGIDAAAHRGALATDAGTVAVIGTGADRVYPARNADLARRIAEIGVVVSEFRLGTPALAANFPRRNRVLAGLAKGVLVVEAAPQSGSLITARLAAEAGREVFAIPGSIHAPQSRGCHQLIRQGAKLVETAADVLDELRWTNFPAGGIKVSHREAAQGEGDSAAAEAPEAQRVLTALGPAPCDLDTLAQRSGLTAAGLLAILLPMELGGRVAQLPGGLYQRIH